MFNLLLASKITLPMFRKTTLTLLSSHWIDFTLIVLGPILESINSPSVWAPRRNVTGLELGPASLLAHSVACQFALMWSAAAAGRLGGLISSQAALQIVSPLQRCNPQRLESLRAASPTSPLFTRCHCVCIRPTAKQPTNRLTLLV